MRNWDPIDIARRVVAGEVCQLGKWLTVEFVGGHFVETCNRCGVKITICKGTAGRSLDELEHFLHRHTHEEVRIS